MPVSIKDIAKEAGVAPSTVSRALNDHPRISSETKALIQNLAKAMRYVPSTVARSLVAKQSATIGVAITDLFDPYYAGLMTGIEEAAAAHNFQVILSSFYRDPDRELAVVYDFLRRGMDGVIITGSYIDNTYLSPDNNFFKPIVIANSHTYPFSVAVDRITGTKKVIEHLVELGHRRIAHVTQLMDGMDRLDGYRAALQQHNIPINEALIVKCDGGIIGGIKAAPYLLDLPQPPTAIFCFNDLTAIGVINALRERGLNVPRDISVVGFDDLEMSTYYHPALTTVRQPTHQIGKRAVKMLLRLINGDSTVNAEVVPSELIIRESTAPVAG